MTPVLTNLPDLPALVTAHLRECARYQVDGLPRVLVTRVTDGQTELLDMPADQFDGEDEPQLAGGSYLVEPDLSRSDTELQALIADYLQQAELHQRLPMTVPFLEDLFDTRPL
jgi:hypothetical protein